MIAQNLNEAESGSQASQGCRLVGIEHGHGLSRLPLWWLVAPGPEVQVDLTALELELVDFALAVSLAPRLEGEDLQLAREMLELGQQFSYRHLSLLCQVERLHSVCNREAGSASRGVSGLSPG
jgi:hypothetical protein